MDTKRLDTLLTALADNCDKQNELNEKIFEIKDEEDWKEFYRGRAGELARLYDENEKLLAEENELLDTDITEETAEALFESMTVILLRPCYEISINAPILNKLIPFYEGTHNVERLVRVYQAGQIVLSHSPAPAGYLPVTKDECLKKTIDLRGFYGELKDSRCRMAIWAAYYNKAVHDYETCTFDEACRRFRDMIELWKSDMVQSIDGENKFLHRFYGTMHAEWVNTLIFWQDVPHNTRGWLADLAKKTFSDEMEKCGRLYRCDSTIYMNYLQARALIEEISLQEAMQLAFEYYKECVAHLGEASDQGVFLKVGELSYEEADLLTSVPNYIIKWAKQCEMKSLPDGMLETLLDIMQNVVFDKLSVSSLYDNNINNWLAEYCFNIAPYISSREKKEQLFFKLVIRRQLPTYIHCTMVQKLALMVFDEMYRDRPEIFADVCGRSEIFANNHNGTEKDALRDFIGSCAIFHDIGKNSIAGVINLQTRKVMDCEFDKIRRHPNLGVDFICKDPDFACYKDVILGHHKFYNGKGGYPADFDNTRSPYRPVIDLITLCDCMDAATDVLGRNYKRAKTCDEVIAEFERDKGVRYNPDMVDYLAASGSLRAKIAKLITEDRINIAYDIYKDAVH